MGNQVFPRIIRTYREVRNVRNYDTINEAKTRKIGDKYVGIYFFTLLINLYMMTVNINEELKIANLFIEYRKEVSQKLKTKK